MKIPSTIEVAGQAVDLSALSDEQIKYYESLVDKISEIYNDKGKGRQVFGLSGPAGSGKSVTVALIGHFFKARNLPFEYVPVGLDAFHYTNDVLDGMNLRAVKGRYDTYNLPLLTKKLQSFTAGEDVSFPTYSRTTHNPIPDAISIHDSNTLLLLEGQWLLRKNREWAKIRDLCSYQLAVVGDLSTMRANVVARHMAGGRSHNDAEDFYEKSDLPNTQEILKNSFEPDEKIRFYKDI